jgi:hypothetical protein
MTANIFEDGGGIARMDGEDQESATSFATHDLLGGLGSDSGNGLAAHRTFASGLRGERLTICSQQLRGSTKFWETSVNSRTPYDLCLGRLRNKGL